MDCNVGKGDRLVRAIIGPVTLHLGYTMSSWFYIIAVIALITAIVGICPAYYILKVNTCKASPAKKGE